MVLHFNAGFFCYDRQKYFHNTLEKRVINLPSLPNLETILLQA